MADDPATLPEDNTPATPADAVTQPEQPPMNDDAGGATPDEKDEAAKLGDFA